MTPARSTSRAQGLTARALALGLGACLAATLAACGGGGGGGTSVVPDRCSVNAQKQFVLDVARSWYLFPELLPANVNAGSYPTPQALLDDITAAARAQGRDRFYSYVTTRQEDEAQFTSGAFAGFGFRSRIEGGRILLLDVFEATPAFEGGLRRGAEILAIDARDGRGYLPVSTWLSTDPNLQTAFGPPNVGVQRGFRYRLGGETREVLISKRENTIQPIPDGALTVLTLPSNPSVRVGYVALRSYIASAQTPLVNAFRDTFPGIDYFIVDLRYNGGGLVSLSDLLGNLFGRGRSGADLYSGLRFNSARSAENRNTFFQPRPESVRPLRIAFITTGATASASEMTVNSMDPWVSVAIIGEDTFGKPVGQSAFDLPGCDTRLRLVTFRTVNAEERGDYYNGLASEVASCAAGDDLERPFGDPQEASTAAALGWIATGTCTPIASVAGQQKLRAAVDRRYPEPAAPTPAQRWLPGLF